MPHPHAISEATKAEILYRLGAGASAKDIAIATRVSERYARELHERYHVTGSIEKAKVKKLGRPPKLTETMKQDIKAVVINRPCIYLEEIQYFLLDIWDVWVHHTTISRVLKGFNYSRKVAQHAASQRNQHLRDLFWNEINTMDPSYVVCVDESAFNERTMLRKYGYAPRGIPALVSSELRRTERWSLLPAYAIDGFLTDPLIIKRGVTADDFTEWLEQKVLPQMQPYPAPRSVLLLDNASIHHGEVCILIRIFSHLIDGN
jgi:transposase